MKSGGEALVLARTRQQPAFRRAVPVNVSVRSRLRAFRPCFCTGEVAAGVKLLRKWETKAVELRTKQTELRQKTATPRAEALGESQHLLSAILWQNLYKDTEELKHRLRSCLKRVIDKSYCSFWGTRYQRYAVAQITFHDSKAIRLLAIDYTPKRSSSHKTVIPAKWDVWYENLEKLMSPTQVEKLFD